LVCSLLPVNFLAGGYPALPSASLAGVFKTQYQ
jgi:hypothetical protein